MLLKMLIVLIVLFNMVRSQAMQPCGYSRTSVVTGAIYNTDYCNGITTQQDCEMSVVLYPYDHTTDPYTIYKCRRQPGNPYSCNVWYPKEHCIPSRFIGGRQITSTCTGLSSTTCDTKYTEHMEAQTYVTMTRLYHNVKYIHVTIHVQAINQHQHV